jgi:hypothetical protein
MPSSHEQDDHASLRRPKEGQQRQPSIAVKKYGNAIDNICPKYSERAATGIERQVGASNIYGSTEMATYELSTLDGFQRWSRCQELNVQAIGVCLFEEPTHIHQPMPTRICLHQQQFRSEAFLLGHLQIQVST